MNRTFTLASLPIGESAVIASLAADTSACRRLRELGFSQGNEVHALFRAPLGDPTAYAVCGTVMALRRSDAEKIFLLSSGKA